MGFLMITEGLRACGKSFIGSRFLLSSNSCCAGQSQLIGVESNGRAALNVDFERLSQAVCCMVSTNAKKWPG
jgi:hypothetical protein